MSQGSPAERVPDWRPRLHLTAPRGWINDPNGLVKVGEVWHAQYQYLWPRCWGHATSRDLFHWEHLPVALQPDANGDCWSGGTVHDHANTSGLFPSGQGGLVSVYTSQHEVLGQRISLATSTEDGRVWQNLPGNPILRREKRDCRDPKVFWDEKRNRWAMVLTESHHLTFFTSPDLRRWTETGRFTPKADPAIDGYECPDLFSLPVEGQPGRSKWILASSYVKGENFTEPPGFGVCSQRYYVGEYDGAGFIVEQGEEALEPFGHGPDEYAAIVWAREATGARRTLAIGWMNHWGYAKQVPTAPWQGCLTMARELTLHEVGRGKWELRQAPARELWALAHSAREFPLGRRTPGQGAAPLGRTTCGAIRTTLRFREDASFEFELFANPAVRTTVGYDATRRTVYVDRRQSGSPEFNPNFALRKDAPLRLEPRAAFALVIMFDVSTVEVFAGDGAVYFAAQTLPPAGADAVNFKVTAGEVEIERLELREFD